LQQKSAVTIRRFSSAAEHAQWLERRDAELRAPDGWLTLTGLFWLDDGAHSVGSAPECAIQLSAGPARLGVLSVKGTHAQWQPVTGDSFDLQSDSAGTPTVISCEALSFFLIQRDDRLALRLRDRNAATRVHFRGIKRFDFNPAWQINAAWDGERASFVMGGNEFFLRPQVVNADKPLQFVIADQTSGRQTYGGGRFLFAEPAENGHLLLDFNRAINPPCVFTPFAVCPLPPAENRLPFAIDAGEFVYAHP
jgi:uncharacterized protein (DUF1684 family)